MEGIWLDLGLTRYAPAFEIQERILAERMTGRLPPVVILQENLPVFTVGRSGSRMNVLVPESELNRRGIEVIEVNRGGDVTYHGPGQLILSTLFFLGDVGMNGVAFMHRMEDVLLNVLADFDLKAEKRAEYPGAWLGGAKIGAVGIAVRHGFTFHGVSLNVNLDLEPFSLINPCGVVAMPMTSMQAALQAPISVQEVQRVLYENIEEYFDLDLHSHSWEQISAGMACVPVEESS